MKSGSTLLDLGTTSDTTPGSGGATGDTATEICPKCGTQESWGMNSWCPQCGYYPTLSDERQATGLAATTEPDADLDAEPTNIFNILPGWVWITLGGTFAIFGGSIGIRLTLERSGGNASAISWPMLIGGLSVALTAHVLALRYAMKHDKRVTLNDGLIAWFIVWQPTIAELPETRRRIWSLVWGGTAALCAIAIVGGMNLDWLLKPGEPHTFDKGSAITGSIADAAAEQAPESASLEEALEKVADRGDDSIAATVAAEPENVLTGTIFGFQADRRGVPLNFLFSGITRNARQHVATISVDDLPEDTLKIIVMRLHNTARRTPATPTIYPATWVEPLVDCRLEYDSIAETGTLTNPVLVEILRPTKNRSQSGGSDTATDSDDSASEAGTATGGADPGTEPGGNRTNNR